MKAASDPNSMTRAIDRAVKDYQLQHNKRPDLFPELSREQIVAQSGLNDGVEHLTWIATTNLGNRLVGGIYTSFAPDIVKVNDYSDDCIARIKSFLKPKERVSYFEIFHNHPRRTPLSPNDLQIGIFLVHMNPALKALFAKDYKLHIYAVAQTDSNSWLAYRGQSLTDPSQLPLDDDEE